jgi:hypothetical protein
MNVGQQRHVFTTVNVIKRKKAGGVSTENFSAVEVTFKKCIALRRLSSRLSEEGNFSRKFRPKSKTSWTAVRNTKRD